MVKLFQEHANENFLYIAYNLLGRVILLTLLP